MMPPALRSRPRDGAARSAAAFLLIAASLAGGVGAGCAATQPMTETEIASDPAALDARATVVNTAIGAMITDADGKARTGAVRPVTCVRLPGGRLLTAAHTLAKAQLGAAPMQKDPVTGAWRVDRRTPLGEGEPLILVVDDDVGTARVSAADTLRYATAPEASRASAAADWAVITPDHPEPWATPVRRIGAARTGERCFMVGFPAAMMDPELFETGAASRDPRALPWLDAPGVILEGRVVVSGRDRILIETGGALGAKARGLSGGGVFVDRGDGATLVGIAVQASAEGGEVTACPLPNAVTAMFD